MKDFLDMAGYTHRGAEATILAQVLCKVERGNVLDRLWVPLISLDPRVKVYLEVRKDCVILHRIYLRPDSTVETSIRVEIYIPDPAVVLKNLLYYEINVEQFLEENPHAHQDPCVPQMLSNSPTSMLQERIRNMITQRRSLTIAEKDFTEILRKYPLKKRSSHSKKSLLSMPRIISESFLVGSSRGGSGGVIAKSFHDFSSKS
jgi:hypothetical protein